MVKMYSATKPKTPKCQDKETTKIDEEKELKTLKKLCEATKQSNNSMTEKYMVSEKIIQAINNMDDQSSSPSSEFLYQLNQLKLQQDKEARILECIQKIKINAQMKLTSGSSPCFIVAFKEAFSDNFKLKEKQGCCICQ